MTTVRHAALLLLATALAACGDAAVPAPSDGAPDDTAARAAAVPADAPVEASLPEVRYYQISDG